MERIWTLDVGNSRAKLREWEVAERARLAATHDWSDEAGAQGWLESVRERLDRAEARDGVRIALSCVASREIEARVAELVRSRIGAGWLGTPDSGLDNRCTPPESVGQDRLFAARGAFAVLGRSALVVDVGTAMTVDALVVDASVEHRRPSFAGGAIAPGPALLARSLHRHTARLPLVEVRRDAPALAVDTAAAIASGVLHGLRGAARELVERIGAEARIGKAPIVVTGGAAEYLLQPELFEGREVHALPELVHVGLLEAALDAVLGAGRPRGGATSCSS